MGFYVKYCRTCNLMYDVNVINCNKCGHTFSNQDITFYEPPVQHTNSDKLDGGDEIKSGFKTFIKYMAVILGGLFVIGLYVTINKSPSDKENLVIKQNEVVKETVQKSEVVSNNEIVDNSIRKESIEETVVESVVEEIVETESEEDYKASCRTDLTYKQVLRNPEDYIGERICIDLRISTVHEESLWNGYQKYYFAYSESDYGWYGDYYGIFDVRYNENDFKILSDDIIRVWGEVSETEHTASIILSSQEVFCIDMRYAELLEE